MAIAATTIIGALASMASMISFIPQAVRIIRTRDTSGLSRGTYAVTVSAFVLWSTYGIVLGDWAITITNVVCAVVACFILVMVVLPDDQSRKVAAKLDPTSPS